MQTRFALVAALVLAPALAAQAAEPTTTATRHANGEHPAVLVARQAQTVNTNTYLVQPPVGVTWTVQAESKLWASAEPAAPKAR